MSTFVGIRNDKGKDGSDIFPVLENFNGTFAINPSSLTENKDFCLMEPRLYDESGSIIFELRKSEIVLVGI